MIVKLPYDVLLLIANKSNILDCRNLSYTYPSIKHIFTQEFDEKLEKSYHKWTHRYFAKHYGGSSYSRSIYLSPRAWMGISVFVTKQNHTLRYYTSSSNHDFSTEHHQVTIRCGLDCCQKIQRTMRKINNAIHRLVGKDNQSIELDNMEVF